MISDQILYTDGHHVVVTPSTFQVRDTFYKLNGITKHGLATVKAFRLPGFLMLLVGAALVFLGVSGLLPTDTFQNAVVGGRIVTAGMISLWSGIILVAFGLIVVSLTKERYAVRIATAEGEKNAVVSKKREYITQILNALNRAFMMDTQKNRAHTKK